MNIEEVRLFCINKVGVTEGFPFDSTTLVFKVVGKMFALLNLSGKQSINLKCDPTKAIELREHYSWVQPGCHMNKKHWNTIVFDDSISDNLIKDWINESYDLIVANLSKKLKEELEMKND